MQFPDWKSFTPSKAAELLEKHLGEAEKGVCGIEASAAADYESTVYALDDACRELWLTWGKVEHLLGVMNSPEWRKLEEDWQPKIVSFSLRVMQSPGLYRKFAAARDALVSEAGFSPTRKRILDKAIEAAELSGVGLEGEAKNRFNGIQTKLAKLGADFSNAVIDATAAYKFEKDGKTYTIDDAAYVETMKTCADREVRENLLVARSRRAPENSERIDEILRLRDEKAKILDFPTYADLSISEKCAPSLRAVEEMIKNLDDATAARAEDEDRELETVMPAGYGKIEPWDVTYLSERLREQKYSYSEEELKKHFEFNVVLSGLFRLCRFLFGFEVEELTGGARPSVWHDDVRFFAVKESGRTVANFYLDPYVRPGLKQGGAWMNHFRNRDGRTGELPLALIVLNLKAPDAEGKTYMPMREVETLFHEFGHALQCMLTKVDEEGAAGINLVEWDAVEVASQFMENWCLDDRTGIEVPADLKEKVKAARNFRAASLCRRQLALAKTDLDIHTTLPDCADDVKKANFAHFGMPLCEGDIFLCSFTHIFSGGYAAGYYGYKWSEVMSADCYGAFEDAGLENDEAVRRTGARYRDTVLALGGSKSAYDVFVDFRGRKPEIDALLRQQGLK